jgi:hypothetical protein
MNLPVHPVFQNILNSEDLKGTLFIPTTKAWDSFFATMRQRQGNPAAPAMVARYGQILLYHLAKVCCEALYTLQDCVSVIIIVFL